MTLATRLVAVEDIRLLREAYQREMDCQIVHESLHIRPGWTREYALVDDEVVAGYGSVAVAGPWLGKPTVFEFYVLPHARAQRPELFRALLGASGAVTVAGQSNDPHIADMVRTFSQDVKIGKILFRDVRSTSYAPTGATFRSATAEEAPETAREELWWRGIVEVGGQVAATGGVLFHYNRPYGDVYMEVAAPFRRRGYGTFLVQELKRRCRDAGHIPGARCDPDNVASVRTLRKAGFSECGHLLVGTTNPECLGQLPPGLPNDASSR